MSLSERRSNVPHFNDSLPVFQLQTPNRSVHRMVSVSSIDSIASYETTDTIVSLPAYMADEEDSNPDVITTFVEIDPDEDELDGDTATATTTTTTMKAALPTTKEVSRTKKSGLSKLFSKLEMHRPTQTPGIRLTQLPRMLRSFSKDVRHGFPLSLPIVDGKPLIEMNTDQYMQGMSRINILLATGALKDVQPLIDSHEALKDHVTFVKYANAREEEHEEVEVLDTRPISRSLGRSASPAFLTVPELDPMRDDSDEDDSSLHSIERRGSAAASICSATSSKSSISQRIRSRLERKEEWCLIFDV